MNDLYTRITDKIIEQLQAGTVPWIRPWAGGDDPFPRNALSQRAYRGINTIVLGLEAELQGYATNQWMTFRQANQLGGKIRKGETSVQVIWYELRVVENDDEEFVNTGEDRETPQPDKRFFPLLKAFNVFNLDQIDGLPDDYRSAQAVAPSWDPCVKAE
ncbi:MAG: ArdC family protein [Deltaproteobacteria bacterium]|nr:ArdC family protein [Deltaproteobacteria bacterium]